MRGEATCRFIQLASSRRERNPVIAKSDEFFAALSKRFGNPAVRAP